MKGKMTGGELWNQLKKGDRNALEVLFRRYYDDLLRYAVKFCGSEAVAEDHIQDLFLKIWRKRKNLGSVTAVKTYLWTALRRSLIQRSNRESRKSELYAELGEETNNMQFAVEEIIIQKEKNKQRQEALKEAFDELTPRQREIIYLRYYDGMTYEEIESITSLNYQTLRNYVYESLQVLNDVISRQKDGVLLTTLVISQLICCIFLLLKIVN